ncbi:MAG: hypothetical protein K5798_03110 [Nitrosopumilus sp.]|uniref:hypothetical protein n=1 Tax=Nitrosopumilus TaxID=338191 RepID=UPI00190F166B|nr:MULTISPECIES: hypothetical protein [Nitrosopumilus]MCV0366239.1 hypothetical protein [Nitrosopumilus sp.]BDQ30390.1 hypothetical protein NZOSNM25_000493 [Nitrosopumilus zosterae]
MKTKISFNKSLVKNILKRETTFSNTCKICNMEFTDPERTKKHMIKAHSKPKREK